MVKHRIRGKMYDLVYVPNSTLPKDDGECDPPTTPGKQIRVAKRCKGLRLLIVLLHEALHAGLWDLDEAAVEELAEDAGRLIWREMPKIVGQNDTLKG